MSIIEIISEKSFVIETERLRIYQISQNNKIFYDLFEIYSNAKNVHNYCQVAPNFQLFCNYHNQKIQEHQIDFKGMISLVFELKENSKVIGLRNFILDAAYVQVGNPRFDSQNLITEIIINKKYWKKGIATEASEAIFDFLKHNGVKNVLSLVNPDNEQAIALDKKLGFEETEYLKAYYSYRFHRDFKIHSNNKNDLTFIKTL